MLKYCGNCGTQLTEGAKVCGQCGVPITSDVTKATESVVLGINYVNSENKVKLKKRLKLGVTGVVIIMLLVVLINFVLDFIGYKGVVRKIMDAYKNYDIEVFVEKASDWYYSFEDDTYAERTFESSISSDLDMIEETVGRKYKLNYEITDSYNLSKHKFENLLEQLSGYDNFDTSIITEVMIVELEIVAKGEEKDMTMNKQLYLTKENDEWRLLYFY